MNKVVETFKNMFLDSVSMGKGFIYGFMLVGLLILIGGAFLYGILFIRNLVFWPLWRIFNPFPSSTNWCVNPR